MTGHKEIFSVVTAIILNYNSSTDTIALYKQVKSFYNDINCTVVDNNSDKNDQNNLLSSIDPNDLILHSENVGYAGGNNVAIKKAIENGAEYVWILNPDISVLKNTLPILLATINTNTTIAAVGARICYKNNPSKIYSDGGIVIKEKGFYTTHLNYNKDLNDVVLKTKIVEADYVNGSVMLLSVDALKQIGYMFEDFFLYFEETEWCLRAKSKNFKLLINTEAVAFHSESLKGETYSYYMVRNRLLLAKLQNEYFFKTVKEVWKKVFRDFKKNLKNRKITKKTKSEIKGFINGITHKLKI